MDEVKFGFNQFCGPAALSVLSGKNTDECAWAISHINGQYKIKGVTVPDLIAAGKKLGLLFEEVNALVGRSLFFTASAMSKSNGRYLIVIPKHFIVVEVLNGNIMLCDNHTKNPIKLESSARLMQRVERVYAVTTAPPEVIPVVVSSTYSVDRIDQRVTFKQIDTLSDGGIKIRPLGSITLSDTNSLQELAFALMQLADKERG